MALLITIIGWVGAITLLVGFYLNASKRIDSQSRLYIYLNLFGSLLLVVNAYYNEAWPFVLINVFWVMVSTNYLLNPSKTKA